MRSTGSPSRARRSPVPRRVAQKEALLRDASALDANLRAPVSIHPLTLTFSDEAVEQRFRVNAFQRYIDYIIALSVILLGLTVIQPICGPMLVSSTAAPSETWGLPVLVTPGILLGLSTNYMLKHLAD